MASKSASCERCGANFQSRNDDLVCLVCLTELEEEEQYESYCMNCAANGMNPLNYDDWVKEVLDADTTF